MPLAKILDGLTQNMRGGCPYQALYEKLSKEDQKALDDAWDRGVPLSLVVKAIRQEGHKTSSDSVRAHRKGQCKCPKR